MADPFEQYSSGLESPVSSGASVTPDDSNDLATTARCLYVGGAGNISVDFIGGETAVVFVGVPAGTLLPFRVSRVRSSSTTATSIVALW